jgi:hypothetical protein
MHDQVQLDRFWQNEPKFLKTPAYGLPRAGIAAAAQIGLDQKLGAAAEPHPIDLQFRAQLVEEPTVRPG